MRYITQADMDSAARGLNMLAKSPRELDALAGYHEPREMFASQVIAKAARQIAAVKRLAGHAND